MLRRSEMQVGGAELVPDASMAARRRGALAIAIIVMALSPKSCAIGSRTLAGSGTHDGRWFRRRGTLLARASAQTVLQSRAAAVCSTRARPRRHRRHFAVQCLLPDRLQRHRAQGGRAAPLCRGAVASSAGSSGANRRRLLSGDVPQAADVGRGRAAVPCGDDAARSASSAVGHRPLHSGGRHRRQPGSSVRARATPSTWALPSAAPCATSSSTRPGLRSTTWARVCAWAWRACRWPTATIR